MELIQKWEMFYTESKNDEDLVDQVSIDTKNKRYVLDIDADYLVTDGYYEDDEPICSIPISRFVFDLIIKGLKTDGFIEYVGEDA